MPNRRSINILLLVVAFIAFTSIAIWQTHWARSDNQPSANPETTATVAPNPAVRSWTPIDNLDGSLNKVIHDLRYIGVDVSYVLREAEFRITTEEINNPANPTALRQTWTNSAGNSVIIVLDESSGPYSTTVVVRGQDGENYSCVLGGLLPTDDPRLVVADFGDMSVSELETNGCHVTGR